MKHLLKLSDLSSEEILGILNLADQLKYEQKNGIEHHLLKGKTLGMQVIDVEKPYGVVVAFGGQTAINLTHALSAAGVRILGTSAESIDLAEDRSRFDALLEKYNIRRPKGHSALNLQQAKDAAEDLGYPVLLRPSYVIGGQNMDAVSELGLKVGSPAIAVIKATSVMVGIPD